MTEYIIRVPATITYTIEADNEKEALEKAEYGEVDRDDEEFKFDKAKIIKN